MICDVIASSSLSLFISLDMSQFYPVVCFIFWSILSCSVSTHCPCDETQWCRPISGPPVRESGELYGFYSSHPDHLDSLASHSLNFTFITTLAWAQGPEIMCIAHAHQVRVVMAAPTFDLLRFYTNTSAMDEWIQSTLNTVQLTYYDGIVFDFEEPVNLNLANTYLQLIRETKEAFSQVHPSYQISVCVPFSPDAIDGRIYPFFEISLVADLIYVMDYDVQSQIFNSACIAGANAPLEGMMQGIQRYLTLGIDRRKLVLGVPWYGYRYPCIDTEFQRMKPHDRYCPMQKSYFRGATCTDAVGQQVEYHNIRYTLRHYVEVHQTGGLRWDTDMHAPFFNLFVNSTDEPNVVQFWFDNPESLTRKFTWARNVGLLGVGPFAFPFLYTNYSAISDDDEAEMLRDAQDMWAAFDSFFLESTVIHPSIPHKDETKLISF